MARNPKQDANLAPPFTSDQSREEASKNGRKGGIASGESRRRMRDAKSAIRYLLSLAPTPSLKKNLEQMGYDPDDMTNMGALQARMFTKAMSGDLSTYCELMRLGGYDPEEIRRERESIASERRREIELDAKIEALRGSSAVSVSTTDEDGNNDVVIYLPEIEDEESCLPSEAQDDKSE